MYLFKISEEFSRFRAEMVFQTGLFTLWPVLEIVPIELEHPFHVFLGLWIIGDALVSFDRARARVVGSYGFLDVPVEVVGQEP